MPWTGAAMDRFFAPGLSKLVENGAQAFDLGDVDADNWLRDLGFNYALRFQVQDRHRAVLWSCVRSAQGAIYEYRAGRDALTEFFKRKRIVGLSQYYSALLHFELCVALTDRAYF